MRIWAFPSIYPFDYPGMRWRGTFAHRQYKGLIEVGADLNVIIPVMWNPPFPISELHSEWKEYRKINYPQQTEHDGVKVYYPRISNIRPNRLVKKSFEERYIDAIIRFFKNSKIELNPSTDVFYSQWLLDSVFVQKAAHKLGIKSAILGIGDDVIVWPKESKEKLAMFDDLIANADLVFFNADYLGREATKVVGRYIDYHVTYFGVDYDLFKPATKDQIDHVKKKYGVPVNKIAILIIASPLVRKGWLDLLDALTEIKKIQDNFVLIGGYAGPANINVTEEVERRHLTQNFVNLGEIKPEKLHEVYTTSDIFCLPSHWEGLATVVMEAMSCAIPVITTNICGQPEIVQDNVTGILIPPKQPQKLYDALLLLINDAERRSYYGNNARDFIVNKWGNAADNARKLFDIMNRKIQK